jgi:ABC-type transport system involved in multi-copper enzyme maturation permease subunit
MIRLTWRQFRSQVLVAWGALAAAAIVLIITRPHLVHLYDLGGPAVPVPPLGLYGLLSGAVNWALLAAPALIGIFWGAPLVARELETGTFRLAWTQSVTRTRWLAVKLSLIGVASILVTGFFSLLVAWWSSPIDTVSRNRFDLAWFSDRGLAPVGYAAFAFAVGVTLGALIHRVQPAMATTLAGYIVARIAVSFWVRPHLMAPSHTNVSLASSMVGMGIVKSPSGPALSASVHIPDAWVYSTQIVDNTGRVSSSQYLHGLIAGIGAGGGPHAKSASFQADFQTAVAKLGETHHVLVTYQPADRYWAFQGLETAVFLSFALLLAGLCLWWVRHRLS